MEHDTYEHLFTFGSINDISMLINQNDIDEPSSHSALIDPFLNSTLVEFQDKYIEYLIRYSSLETIEYYYNKYKKSFDDYILQNKKRNIICNTMFNGRTTVGFFYEKNNNLIQMENDNINEVLCYDYNYYSNQNKFKELAEYGFIMYESTFKNLMGHEYGMENEYTIDDIDLFTKMQLDPFSIAKYFHFTSKNSKDYHNVINKFVDLGVSIDYLISLSIQYGNNDQMMAKLISTHKIHANNISIKLLYDSLSIKDLNWFTNDYMHWFDLHFNNLKKFCTINKISIDDDQYDLLYLLEIALHTMNIVLFKHYYKLCVNNECDLTEIYEYYFNHWDNVFYVNFLLCTCDPIFKHDNILCHTNLDNLKKKHIYLTTICLNEYR